MKGTDWMPDYNWVESLLGDRESARTRALRIEDAQVFFELGDRVRFRASHGDTRIGTVEKLNPTRAKVRCGAEAWVVPYAGLDHVCGSTAADRRSRATRLKEVAGQARELMDRHGLAKWSLRFSSARKRLGECRSEQRLILISRAHAATDSAEQITDTILHEIAHALAGPGVGHGPAWKRIARQIGATPKSSAPQSAEARRRSDAAKAGFRAGDSASFFARGRTRTGVIVRMNPKRAKLRCGDVVWSVPYAKLNRLPDDHREGESSSS